MIYISSACVKHDKIKDSVQELVDNGFSNIELSGGTKYYHGFEDDLLDLQYKYKLNYICHNYFPPPKKDFVVNLASLDDVIFKNTVDHLERSINLSKKLNAQKFGFHAGFYYNIPLEQIGKSIAKKTLFDKKNSIVRFCEAFNSIKSNHPSISLFLENNVLSHQNFANFNDNLFMLTNKREYLDLAEKIDFNLILDVAHLKVSCNSLNLIFEQEFDYLFNRSDYIHISDNNGLIDENKGLQKKGSLYNLLSQYSMENKIVTIEVYESMKDIINTHNLITNL